MTEAVTDLCPNTGQPCEVRAETLRAQGIVDASGEASLNAAASAEGRTAMDDAMMHVNDASRAEVFSQRATDLLEAAGDCSDVCSVAKAAITFTLNPHAAPVQFREVKRLTDRQRQAAQTGN